MANALGPTLGDDKIVGAAAGETLNGEGGADRIYGKGGDDTLLGGDGNDLLFGGAGADVLNGGADFDTATYFGSAGVTIDLSSGVHLGDAQGDSFISIERFLLTQQADVFIAGADGVNVNGRRGDDTLTGGNSADLLTGGDGGDKLYGGDGGDTLVGGAGADAFNGGLGADTVKYIGPGSETINLLTGAHSGAAQDDTFNSIELFWLGAGDDVFSAGATGVNLKGARGDDTLVSGVGDDTLTGGAGNDTAVFAGSVFDHKVLQDADGFTSVETLVLDENNFFVVDSADTLDTVEVLQFGDSSFTFGVNNAPVVRSYTEAPTDIAGTGDPDMGWEFIGGFTFLNSDAFDLEGDDLTFELVADNTGDLVDIDFGSDGSVGFYINQWEFIEGAGSVSFTWRVTDGSNYSNVATYTFDIIDSSLVI